MKGLVLRLLALVLVLAGAPGCATISRPPLRLVAVIPAGFERLPNTSGEVYSRDGSALQRIRLQDELVPVTYPNTRLRILEGMSAPDVAEVILGELASSPDKPDFQVLENGPATVAGVPGFRLVVTFRTRRGLRYREIYCGALQGTTYLAVSYVAPDRYYFDKDAANFDATLASAHLTER